MERLHQRSLIIIQLPENFHEVSRYALTNGNTSSDTTGSLKMMGVKPPRTLSVEETAAAQALLARARAAMAAVSHYDQSTVDRLCRAVAWATANEQTFGRLTRMSVEESGMGSADGVPARRWKILGILRDALRTKSVGIIEELPEKGM